MELMSSVFAGHPEEVYCLLKFKLGGYETALPKCDYDQMPANMRTCYQYLNQTSRSFAAAIQVLDDDFRHVVCIFYLVMRALDTVEDDITIPLDTRQDMLRNFHIYLLDTEWKYTESKDKDGILLEDFPTISQEYRKLKPVYQQVISDTCKKMGPGLAEFLQKEVDTLEDWDEYAHYGFGLVGTCLARLFCAAGYEDQVLAEDEDLVNSFSLFLQKTNTIRDYLEDQMDNRGCWPRQVWSKYADKLSDFREKSMSQNALWCLNELVTNALLHVPGVLKYMSRLRSQSGLRFFAMNQVMAMATMARCYNNPAVFQGKVKIRKGEAVKLLMETTNVEACNSIVRSYCEEIFSKISPQDPSYSATIDAVKSIRQLTETSHAM